LTDLLVDLVELGLGDTEACVCRELTKVHEEVRRGTLAALVDYYDGESVRGEVTLVIDGTAGPREDDSIANLAGAQMDAARLAKTGMSTREIARTIQEAFGLARNQAYETALGAVEPGADEGVSE